MNNLLQKIMITDFALTGAVAVLQLAAADVISSWLGISTFALRSSGFILILFITFVGYLLKTNNLQPAPIKSIILINIFWAVGCGAFMYLEKSDLTILGFCFVAIHVITVLGFAFLQNMGLKISARTV